jgi:hypothetical protein
VQARDVGAAAAATGGGGGAGGTMKGMIAGL